MAIEKGSQQLHEINVAFLVELVPEWGPYSRALEAFDTLTEYGLVEGMRFIGSRELTFEKAVADYEPKVWGEDVLCSTACDVNAGCECHGGFVE